jgi:hypothetical protein
LLLLGRPNVVDVAAALAIQTRIAEPLLGCHVGYVHGIASYVYGKVAATALAVAQD